MWINLNKRWKAPNYDVLRVYVIEMIDEEMLTSFIYSSIYFYKIVKKKVSVIFSSITFFHVANILAPINGKVWIELLTLPVTIKRK